MRPLVCQPRLLPSSAARSGDFQTVPVAIGMPADEFAEGGGCSKLMVNVRSKMGCAAECIDAKEERCEVFYFNKAKKGSLKEQGAQGWKKFVILLTAEE